MLFAHTCMQRLKIMHHLLSFLHNSATLLYFYSDVRHKLNKHVYPRQVNLHPQVPQLVITAPKLMMIQLALTYCTSLLHPLLHQSQRCLIFTSALYETSPSMKIWLAVHNFYPVSITVILCFTATLK